MLSHISDETRLFSNEGDGDEKIIITNVGGRFSTEFHRYGKLMYRNEFSIHGDKETYLRVEEGYNTLVHFKDGKCVKAETLVDGELSNVILDFRTIPAVTIYGPDGKEEEKYIYKKTEYSKSLERHEKINQRYKESQKHKNYDCELYSMWGYVDADGDFCEDAKEISQEKLYDDDYIMSKNVLTFTFKVFNRKVNAEVKQLANTIFAK